MVKKAIWMIAIAGAVWLAATYLRRAAPVVDAMPDPVPASIEPARDASQMTLVVPSPRPAVAPEAIQPQRTLDETLAELAEAILAGLNSTNESGRDLVLTNLLPQLVALDPATAGRLAETIEDEAGRRDALRVVAQGWSAKDLAAALAWADQLSEPNERTSTLTDAAFQIAQLDPAKAIGVAQQYRLGEGIGDVLPVLAVQWADKDLSAALAWAGDQPAGDQRNQIMARIAFVQSQTAPSAAGVLVLAQIPPGPVQEEAVMSVLNQWAQKDLSGVSAWVYEFPEGPFKERALAELAAVRRSDPPSAPPESAAPESSQ